MICPRCRTETWCRSPPTSGGDAFSWSTPGAAAACSRRTPMRQSKSFEKKPRAAWALPALLASGCIGVSQPKADASAPSKDALSACPGGLVPAADGLIDDFEDGDNQGALEAGRDGYWYTAHDDLGSEYSIPAQGFATAD